MHASSIGMQPYICNNQGCIVFEVLVILALGSANRSGRYGDRKAAGVIHCILYITRCAAWRLSRGQSCGQVPSARPHFCVPVQRGSGHPFLSPSLQGQPGQHLLGFQTEACFCPLRHTCSFAFDCKRCAAMLKCPYKSTIMCSQTQSAFQACGPGSSLPPCLMHCSIQISNMPFKPAPISRYVMDLQGLCYDMQALPFSASGASVSLYAFVLVTCGLLKCWAAPACNNPIFAEIVPPHMRNLVYAFDRCAAAILQCHMLQVER